MKNIRIWKKSS